VFAVLGVGDNSSGFRAQGSVLRAQGEGLRIKNLGLRLNFEGSEFTVYGLRLGARPLTVKETGFRNKGSVFRVHVLEFERWKV
jgi:hypothetical protein